MGVANTFPTPSVSVLGVQRPTPFKGLPLRRNKTRGTAVAALHTTEACPLPSTKITAKQGKGGDHVSQAVRLTLPFSTNIRPLARHVQLVVGRVRPLPPSPPLRRRRIR